MDPQKIWRLFIRLTCVFVLHLPSMCAGLNGPRAHLETTVFVALRGEAIVIEAHLHIPRNQSKDILKCFDPSQRMIYHCDVTETTDQPLNTTLRLEPKDLTSSGEYRCQYKTATVYWFLRLRDEGYSEPIMWDPAELIGTILTSGLLLFSVVGSVYVFRGNWPSRKHEQKREERMGREAHEDNLNVVTDPSTSFYASLEQRPGSIYDVLDRSTSKGESDRSKDEVKKKEPQQAVNTVQTTQNQHEDVVECVYENF